MHLNRTHNTECFRTCIEVFCWRNTASSSSVSNTFSSDVNTHTHTTILCLWILSATTQVSQYQKKHSATHTHIVVINHPLSAFSIYCNPWHPLCSIYVPDSLFPQSLSKFSLVFLLAWHPPLHSLYISSPNNVFFSQHMPIPSHPVLLWY